ncbi:alpha/beta fold hydrolase [Pasteurellaceae bacterium 22721_9_1]
MSIQQLLHYQFTPCENSKQPTLVFIHGLFGDMNNLGVLARAFSDHYPILRVDLRNHGQSFHSDEMNYEAMAQDIVKLVEHLQLDKLILIGHSMGGKTAMKVATLIPELIEKLVVIDIAPVAYSHRWHDKVFAGLFAVAESNAETRQQAKPILAKYIEDESVQQFMLKSFDINSTQKFRFNFTALYQHYDEIMGWDNQVATKVKTLFIKGGLSNYISEQDTNAVLAQFPLATSFTINGAGHWVHAEKPEFVIRAIQRFLQSD